MLASVFQSLVAEKRQRKGGQGSIYLFGQQVFIEHLLCARHGPLRGVKQTGSTWGWGRQMVNEGEEGKKEIVGFFEVRQGGLESPEGL